MTYRDILVHVDNTPQCAARIAVAADLAKQHQAHLTGLYAIAARFGALKTEPVEAAEKAKENFDNLVSEHQIAAEWCVADWETVGGTFSTLINHYAHLKDLVVLGQSNTGSPHHDAPADLPDKVVLESGRPVLIVPFAGSFPTVGERVMVCWRHGRESVRALTVAMPFLAKAKDVRVIMIDPPEVKEKLSEGQSTAIISHLARHGIEARVEHVAPANISIGDMLLNESWEDGRDLLVMGAYMRTGQGDIRTGPVARHILQHMTLPVLMAH